MVTKRKSTSAESSELTFEEAVKELEQVVRRLEGGDLSLDNSLAAFEEGIRLARACERQLEAAKGRVEMLLKKEGGGFREVPFEPGESS